jgi:hypothetical protein
MYPPSHELYNHIFLFTFLYAQLYYIELDANITHTFNYILYYRYIHMCLFEQAQNMKHG